MDRAEGNSTRTLATNLRQRVLTKRTLLAFTVGCVSGLTVVVGEISLATVVFSGPLAPYAAQGVGLVLFGSFAGCLVIALTSGFLGAVSAPPVPTLIVLAVIGGALALEGDALFATMVAIIVLCAFATGLIMLLIGRFGLTNLVRFIPYPVSSGFVAGTGGVACLVALSLMGIRFDRESLAVLFDPSVAANWGIGIVYGVGLYLATKFWNSFLLLPVSFLATAALCHVGLMAMGISGDEARAAGLLFASISDGHLWPAFDLEHLALVDWGSVAGQIPNMLTLLLVTFLCIVMYIGGLELAANRDLDWNREFRVVGFAAFVAGLGGGPPGCQVVPTSMRSLMFGVDMRFTGVVAALLIGSTLLFGDALLKHLPVPLMGGVLLFTGIAMLEEWLVRIKRRVPATDYAIILVMFLTITIFGFFEGVGIGMLITIVFFIVRLSRMDVIESRYTARERRSNRSRPIPDRAILQTEGDRAKAYRLQGYVFFGSGYPLADRLKESLNDEPPPKSILLDFEAVSGFDFSAAHALCRFMHAARSEGTRVVICAAPEQLRHELKRNLPPTVFDNAHFAADADSGLERCEDIVIEDHRKRHDEEAGALLDRVADEMERHLDSQSEFEALIEALGDWTQVRYYGPDESIVATDAASAGLQLMTSGRASVFDEKGERVGQLGPGDVVETRIVGGPQVPSRNTVTDVACQTIVLGAAASRLLEESDSALALRLYRYILATERQLPAHASSNEQE